MWEIKSGKRKQLTKMPQAIFVKSSWLSDLPGYIHKNPWSELTPCTTPPTFSALAAQYLHDDYAGVLSLEMNSIHTAKLVGKIHWSEDAILLNFFLTRERASRRRHEEEQSRAWRPISVVFINEIRLWMYMMSFSVFCINIINKWGRHRLLLLW